MKAACAGKAPEAFTLVELLVTIAVIGLLTSLLLPALGRGRDQAESVKCVSNLRQLQTCWQLYVDDHAGRLPPNRSLFTNGVWRSTPDSWIGDSSALLDASDEPLRRGLLFRYDYNRSTEAYRCPGDRSHVTGSRAWRTRSYSMNGNLGGRTNEVQRTVLHEGEIEQPSQLFVLIDEHEDSIDDAHFLVWPAPDDRWVNLPADRHGGLAVLSVADGHVERWRWRAAKSFSRRTSYWKPAGAGGDLADLRRLQSLTLPLTNRLSEAVE